MTTHSFVKENETQFLRAQLDMQNAILAYAKELLKLNKSEDIVWAITENVIKKLNFYDCVLYLVDPITLKLVQRSAHGPKNPNPKQIVNPIELSIGEGIVGAVAQTGIAEIISDTRLDKRYIADEGLRLSEIAVPIMTDGKVIGVIDAEHPDTNHFNEQHLKYLNNIASLSAVTLQNALNKELLEIEKDNLEIEITKRTEKLEETLAELQRSNEELKNFAHVVSHDLKQPLRTINGFINLIKMKEIHLSEQSKEFFSYVSDGTLRMQDIINALLNYAKVSNPDHTETIFELGEIIHEVLEDLNHQVQESKSKITIGEMPNIVAFEALIKQVFQNLISNSIKFRQKDKTPIIEISSHQDDQYCYISIKDNGIGIPENKKDKVFEMFHRIHSVKDSEGTGMGLSFCKKIIEMHKGSITIDSKEENQGTTVTFSINKSQF